MPDTDEVLDDVRDSLRERQQMIAQIGGELDAAEGLGFDPDTYEQCQQDACERWDAGEYEPGSILRLFDAYKMAYPDADDWVAAAKAVVSILDTSDETQPLPVPTPPVAWAINGFATGQGIDPRSVVDSDSPHASRVRLLPAAGDVAEAPDDSD